MSESPHTILWKRVTSALHGRAIGPASSQGALAAEARTKLGTDLVERFLNGYFFERQYGGGNSAMTEEQAEALVRQIENLPQPIAPEPVERAVPRGVILESDKPMPTAATTRDWSVLEEAEAYGEEERRGSPLDAVRQWVLELRVRGDARRRQRERLKMAAVEARESEVRARARLKEQASARQTEEEAARRQHAQQRAEAEKQQRIAVAAAESESLLQTAGKLRGEGDKVGAVAVLGKLVRQQPDSAMGWFTLGWYFGRDGNFRRSTRCYKKGLALDPGQKTAWNNLGHDLRGMRRYKASEQALRQAIKLDPDYVTAWANLGTTLREKKKFSEAASAFHEVVRHRETDGAAWYWLGVCRAGCGDHLGAVEALQRAAVMHPDNATLWMQLADSLRKLGRTEEAAQAMAKANALGIPAPMLRREVPLLALVAVIASFGADRLTSALLGLAATVAFAAMVARLSLDRVKFFWIAVLALPLLAVQFIDAPHAAPIAMGVLLVWTAAVTKIWRYRRGKRATGSPQPARTN